LAGETHNTRTDIGVFNDLKLLASAGRSGRKYRWLAHHLGGTAEEGERKTKRKRSDEAHGARLPVGTLAQRCATSSMMNGAHALYDA
jgi:hypothetical protein